MHFAIEFDDGKKWMVRAKKISQVSPPLEVDKAQIFSEAATFKRLHEAGVKVPQVWLPSEWREHDKTSRCIAADSQTTKRCTTLSSTWRARIIPP